MNIQIFNYAVDLLQAILWQYNEATNFYNLINLKQTWYNTNQEEFWSDWYTNVFDLQTADTFGLAVWALILELPLYIPTETPNQTDVWGFNAVPSENSYVNFENGTFSNLGGDTVLTPQEQRILLQLRYFQLISRGAIPEINTFLNWLFTRQTPPFQGAAYVLDGFDMTITYVFNFTIPQLMLTVFQKNDVLPRPAGVEIKNIITLNDTIFGFNTIPSENIYQNFYNSNFYPSAVYSI